MNLVTTNELTKSLKVTPQRIANIAKELKITKDETIIKGRNKLYYPSAVRKILSKRGVDYNVKSIIAFCNNKGGVGKTSVAVNTALRLSSLGFKVLVIDADAQANSTNYLLSNIEYEHVLYDTIHKKMNLEDVIIDINDYLSVLPSSLINDKCSTALQSLTGVNLQTYFKNKLSKLDFNYIIWDLSPSLGTLNHWALMSCDQISVVTTLEEFSIQGVEMTNDLIKMSMENFSGYKPITKVLINKFDGRMTSSLKYMQRLEETGVQAYEQVIRTDNSMNKSQSEHMVLNNTSNSYKDISAFVDEFANINRQSATLQ